MRTIEVKLYEFEELSAEAKESAIAKDRTINVDFDWWDPTYEGMKEVGIKIDSFDIYYRTISIIIEDSEHTARTTIENFGEGIEVVKISKQFIKDRDALVKRLGEGNDVAGYSVKEEFIDEYDEEIEYLEEQYRKEMSEEILTWLRNDYEYLQTDEAVAETLIANDYEFTENGEIY